MTGDIPELGVKRADDTVLAKKVHKRQTKADVATEMLTSIMTQQFSLLFADQSAAAEN